MMKFFDQSLALNTKRLVFVGLMTNPSFEIRTYCKRVESSRTVDPTYDYKAVLSTS
jgi:hypothetical protein